VASREVADATAQREPADAGGGDDASRGGETERARGVVHVAPRCASFGPRRHARRIDSNTAHRREVDDDATVTRAETGRAVGAAANREIEARLASGRHRSHHVGGVATPHDRGGATIDHRVVDRPRLVVTLVRGGHDVAANLLPKLLDVERAHAVFPLTFGGRRRARSLYYGWLGP
jgi:hypothetical protein